jgi:single-strand DNA-binding protein
MDLNVVVLGGRLAAPPEVRTFDTGLCQVRYLVTVRSQRPQARVDVIPVTEWHSAAPAPETLAEPGRELFVAGSVTRRFWDGAVGRRSRLEITALQVEIRDETAGEGEWGDRG